MEEKTKKFFRQSFFSVIIVCLVVFVWLKNYMAAKTKEMVTNVTDVYMSEMSKQIQQKFEAIIDLQMSQLEGIKFRTPAETAIYGEKLLEELKLSAEIRNFTYLAFLNEEGELERIFGDVVNIDDSTNIMDCLKQGEKIVERGRTADGEKLLLLIEEAEYPLEDGRRSVALVAGVEMTYLEEALFTSNEDELVFYHIIDMDGAFVIRNADAYLENYFERILKRFDNFDNKSAAEYVEELQTAMSNRQIYHTAISVEGEPRHIYCAPLAENSTWYLISVMKDQSLSDSITELDTLRITALLGSGIAILGVMMVILILYLRMSKKQMCMLAEARQEAVRANMAKSEFLSSMSHDIRTPMNAIIGMTEIALKNLNDTTRVEDCLQKVKVSSKHLLGLINDVLDMSKIESGKVTLNMAPMSLRDTMDDIVNIIQPQIKAKDQFFDVFIQNIESEEVYCDSVRLNQVLLNLLSNAVKFTPENGSIHVHVYQEPSPKGEEYVQTHFRVTDTGIGMSEEFQKNKIFDTFSREETEQVAHITGTGLGMAITKCIVDLMEGKIELKSEKGKGSDFHIVVDLKKAAIKEEEMKLPEWNVLVVDDNKQLCTSAVANLEELGVHAEWTLDSRDAIRMIEERHKNNDDYHFVLIDWKMPNMDGVETIHEIRRRIGTEIPIFLISAYEWSDIEDGADSISFEGFISKPLFKSTLYDRLKLYVENNSEEKHKEEKNDIDFTGKNILVAEDIDLNWEVANEILSTTGLKLERAVNGKDCLEKFANSEIGYYDAILMDIRMPVMNGYEATKAIRKLNRADRDLPIIAMTADAFSDDAQHCLECGMNEHIPKPLDLKECMRIL